MDVVPQLWHTVMNAAIDDLLLAFIAMGALDPSANVSKILFPSRATQSCHLLVKVFVSSCIRLKKYEIVKKMVQTCPRIFIGHRCYCPGGLIDADFIANVIVGCGIDVNAVMHEDYSDGINDSLCCFYGGWRSVATYCRSRCQ